MKIGAISTPPNEAANYEYHPEIIINCIHMIYIRCTLEGGEGATILDKYEISRFNVRHFELTIHLGAQLTNLAPNSTTGWGGKGLLKLRWHFGPLKTKAMEC